MAESKQSSRCYTMLFQSCLTCYEPHQNEALYHGLLRCLIHPLGAPETEIGLRPGDLVEYLRQVFDVDQGDHDRFVREQHQNKPKKIQVCATVIEAKDLDVEEAVSDARGRCKAYCLLSLVNPTKGVRRPVSPRPSPRSSPILRRRSPVEKTEDVLRSQPAKACSQPKWNEEFNLEIEDLRADELHVCFVIQEPGSLFKYPEKVKISLKSFIRNVLAASDSDDSDEEVPGSVGHIVMPVRDISTIGEEKWMNVYPVGQITPRTKPVGECRLRLAISYMQTDTQCFSVEDYHQTSVILHKHAANVNEDTYDSLLMLSPKSRRILDIFATANGISKLSQAILDLTVLLELVASPEQNQQHLVDSELHRALEEVQMTWQAMRECCCDAQRMPLSDSEICLYRNATRNYISSLTSQLNELPSLFPPSVESLITLKGSLGLAIHLLELDLWDSLSSPQNELSDKLLHELQCDIDEWITEKMESIYSHRKVKDSVIPEVEALTETVNDLISHCSPLGVITQFYGPLGVKYYRVVAFRTERKVSATTKELMHEMDKYLFRYHSFPINIAEGSRLSLALYFAIRKFYQLVTEGLAERDLFRLTITQYERWFQESLVFWLQTFKTECMSRMEKALEIDKDVVLVTSLVKFSHSSVDVQSCFAKITQEWVNIGFGDPDSNVMGVTKITDMICDAARLYADIIHSILERNCYYHSQEKEFDCTDRLCITLNNIEHVRQYLNQLPELLRWTTVVEAQSVRHDEPKIGRHSLSTLQRLTSTAHHDILMKSCFLLREIAVKMKVNIQKLMEMFIVKSPEKASGVDKTIGYLSTNLRTLEDRLEATIYPKMIEELWRVVLQIFNEQMKSGKMPDYYEHMNKHLFSLSSFFVSCGLEENIVIEAGETLRSRLELNCMTTGALMQEYFQSLANGMKTPPEYLGHLAVKMAFLEQTTDTVTIIVKVMEAFDLPGLDNSGLSDPYVVVNLQPPCLFKGIKEVRTKVVEKMLNPVFNETFKFPNIPIKHLTETGACVMMSVLDYDLMTFDDFIGDVVVHLSDVQAVMKEGQVDAMPVVMHPLKRPQRTSGGPLQVLDERKGWDKEAKLFVIDRMWYIDNQPKRYAKPKPSRPKPSTSTSFFSYFGFKSNVP